MSKIVIFLTVLVLILALILTFDAFSSIRNAIFAYFPFKIKSKHEHSDHIFTKEELSKYAGKEKNGRIYLGLLGQVFDVTKGKKHYGEGGGYSFFSGKDGTRAFVSGDFTEKGLIEDISGLTHTDILGLEDWKSFYHKDYRYMGKLIGSFYDENGNPTEKLREYGEKLKEAKKAKAADEDDQKRFPTCNFSYQQGAGRRIWCSTMSGGIQRSWAGLPRQYFQPGKQEPRCACVKDTGPPSDGSPNKNNNGDLDNPLMKLYEGCDPKSFECRFKE